MAGALVGAVLVILAICEALGWPFLAGPIQSHLASALDRRIDLGGGEGLRIHLIGGVRVHAMHLEIGAPSWSSTPHT
ncbi:MAG: AsmA family protein, partial [Pseudomonadota bacterium]|nr:AsmA family protein [Pseudomonadota bacterium]